MVTGHAIHFDWEIFNVSHPGYVVLIISGITPSDAESRPQTTPSSASTRESLATCSRFLGLSDVIVTRSVA